MMIEADNSGTTQESVVYPVTMIDYPQSSTDGTLAMTKQLTDFVEKRPKTKMLLLGYSQGAQVVLDMMWWGGYSWLGSITPPINQTIGDHGEHLFSVRSSSPC